MVTGLSHSITPKNIQVNYLGVREAHLGPILKYLNFETQNKRRTIPVSSNFQLWTLLLLSKCVHDLREIWLLSSKQFEHKKDVMNAVASAFCRIVDDSDIILGSHAEVYFRIKVTRKCSMSKTSKSFKTIKGRVLKTRFHWLQWRLLSSSAKHQPRSTTTILFSITRLENHRFYLNNSQFK